MDGCAKTLRRSHRRVGGVYESRRDDDDDDDDDDDGVSCASCAVLYVS